MNETDSHRFAPATVTAGIPYTLDTGEKLVNETFGPNNIYRRENGAVERFPMSIRNGRPLVSQFALDRNGFIFIGHDTAVHDFFAPQMQREYYPEVEQLIKHATGAARVVVFDHTLRSGDEPERAARLLREPVLWAHNDYTEWSGPQRVRDLLPDEAEKLLAGRFAIIQVWRATDQPVQSHPLALADARSVAFEDLMIAERRYPNRIGQTYRLRHNPAHRWFYFPEMRRTEALVFKTYDSATDGRARYTPHTSFEDPNTPRGAPPRRSVEARALVFFAG